MGIEFNITKGLATIGATISELEGMDRILREELGASDFIRHYDSLLFDVLNSYGVVTRTLSPLVELSSAEAFQDEFAPTREAYERIYQAALSEPRVNAEYTYEKYLQFRKLREVGTGYPPLKRAFSRLHDFIDKWIDNDIWLAMTIDTLLKQIQRLLAEVAEMQKSDGDAALLMYQSSIGCLQPYLQIIEDRLEELGGRLDMTPVHAGCAADAAR